MNEPEKCSRCGRSRGEDENPAETLAWVSSRDKGVVTWLCPGCARRHTRDIEGKLPDEFW